MNSIAVNDAVVFVQRENRAGWSALRYNSKLPKNRRIDLEIDPETFDSMLAQTQCVFCGFLIWFYYELLTRGGRLVVRRAGISRT